MKDWQKRVITEIAYLYYVKEFSRKDIAQKLGIDRTTVGRMLQRAKNEQIVTFKINDFDTEVFDLEKEIEEKFHLKKVLVSPNSINKTTQEKDSDLAKLTIQYLRKIIQVGDVVGLSWGRDLEMLADGVRNISDMNAVFVPLAGAPSNDNIKFHVNSIVYDMARKFKSKSIFINAAAVQKNVFAAQKVRRSTEYQQLNSYWQQMKTAVVGIGGPLSENSSWRDLLTEEDLVNLSHEKAIGDCCCHFFNAKGEIVDQDLERRLIAYPVQYLKTIENSIGLVHSVTKVDAIIALLKNKLLNTLITDKETAKAILLF